MFQMDVERYYEYLFDPAKEIEIRVVSDLEEALQIQKEETQACGT